MSNPNAIHISVVIPVYRCRDTLSSLCQRLDQSLDGVSQAFEIILVNDGCPDQSWDLIQELAASNPRIAGIDLSRNFGQHHAITAGLDVARGDWVVVMDGDLQDQPEEIAGLYEKAQEGFEVVLAARVNRQDSPTKLFLSRLFYKFLGLMTDKRLDPRVANFGIYSRNVIQAVCRMGEAIRFFPLFILWAGFRTTTITVEHARRPMGESGYSLIKLFRLSLNVIITFSDKPLQIIASVGFLLSFLSILTGFWFILKKFIYGVPVDGWTSLMVSIWFLGGLIIFIIGICGLYIGRIFSESKKRPLYLVRDRCGF